MTQTLQTAFSPTHLEIEDQSHLHAGHAGARPEGETHFQVILVSARFAGLSRVDRQRLVNEVLADEFDKGLHALSLKLSPPD